MTLQLLIYCLCSLCLWSVNCQDVRPIQRIPGPDILVTDGTRNLTLTCPAESSLGGQYTWLTPGHDSARCSTRQSGKVCTFTPRLKDDNQNVTCTLVDPGLVISSAFYQVNLKYPPQSSPSIAIEYPQTEPLKQGDVITCTVSGGKPSVTNVTFHCQDPDLADRDDDVNDNGHTISSSVTVHLSNTTGVYINCTCSATWQPEPDLYSDKTAMSFLLETSPRIMDSSYDRLNPPILEATGHTFFLVADPMPDTITSYFLGTNMMKEPVPENTFTTECTKNSTMTHLVNCRVNPQQVPEEKLGLYEMYFANRLGEVSLRFNVTSPVTLQQDENSSPLTVAIVGAVVGVLLLIGIIVIIVTCLRRRKLTAGHKEPHGSQNRNQNNETNVPVTHTLPTTGNAHVLRPDSNTTTTYDKINDGPSSAGSNTTATRCSTDSKGYVSVGDTSFQGSNKAAPTRRNNIQTLGYEDVELDPMGAPTVMTTPGKPDVVASMPEDPAERITGPKGDVYAVVAPKQKGDNQPVA